MRVGVFQEGINSYRRILAAASDEADRVAKFAYVSIEVAKLVPKGLERTDAADALMEMATAYNVADGDANQIQTMMGEAFRKVEDADKVPDGIGEAYSDYGADARSNGHDKAPQPIPTVHAFPIDASSLPRRPWIVPGLMLRRHVTLMVAPPGSGKSLLTLQLAILCASGIVEWAHWKPRGRYRVLLINVEEDEEEMKRRLVAAATIMGVAQELLGGIYLAKAENIVVAKADNRTKTVVAQPMLESITQTIKDLQIDIVIVDPFAETFVGDENSNSELKWCGVLWREVARQTNAAVFLVHHAKKYASGMAGDPDAGRGGGSLVGIARIVTTLFTMTEKEADRFDMDSDERHKFIRFDDAKTNLTLLGGDGVRWFEKKSFCLNNGGNDNEPADEVGVLVTWKAPSGRPDDATVERIVELIGKGIIDEDGRPTGDRYTRTKAGRANDRWAGKLIQDTIGCSEGDAKRLIRELIDDKRIEEIEEVTSSSKGGKRKGLRIMTTTDRGDMK